MKKLLTFLGITSISSGGMLTVASCSSIQRFSDPTIPDELASKIIAGLKENDNFNFNNGDIFYGSNFKEIIIDRLNQLISEKKYNEISKDLSSTLNTIESKSKDKAEQVLTNLATLKLFNEYTAKRSDKGNTDQVDLTYRKGPGLNPYELEPQNKNKEKKYAIYYKKKEGSNSSNDWLRWQTTGEFTPEKANDSEIEPFQIPELSVLTDSKENFRIGILEKPDDINYIKNTSKVKDDGKGESDQSVQWYKISSKDFITTGKDIIKYRFAYYFKTEIKSKLFANLLGNSYLDSNLYFSRNDNSSASDKKIVLSGTNRLINNVQSNFTQQDSTISNIKMVWSFSNSETNNTLKKISGSINSDGSLIRKKTLKNLYSEIISSGVTNNSKQGNDPFLSMDGFNGFVQNDKDSVKSLSGDLKVSESAKKDIAKVSTPSILTNGGSGYESTIKGDKDFIFVLPIYLNDIFSTNDIQFNRNDVKSNYTLNVLTDTWTDISQKYKLDEKYFNESIKILNVDKSGSSSVEIAKKNNKWYVKLKNGSESDQKINITYSDSSKIDVDLKKIEQREYKTLDITQRLSNNKKNIDIFGSNLKDSFISYDYNLKDYQNLKEKQNDAYEWNQSPKSSTDILDLSTENKQALLDQLKSITSSIEDVQNAAKTELYSQYLNADQIKYKELFDEISKFVRDDIPSLD
ncbi:hypothetical protein [Mycoplasma putrefaciens]|uniref:Lipoprotein n=1 Tax=Mycoplasma putrefaciens Mput9231 TaxID=1292033 RepID=M9WHF0_9MOLU|nr:hypothetical protein [Mycoplasma putrefaciens]AGJ90890.1 Hypothetical protein, predicted lipoprotein [Mycoplasma putrefaciens Mput9231]